MNNQQATELMNKPFSKLEFQKYREIYQLWFNKPYKSGCSCSAIDLFTTLTNHYNTIKTTINDK